MIRNYLLSCLVACFLTGIVAREAIIHGHSAFNDNAFPYQVMVRLYGRWYDDCGGGIISPLHILTAAHCAFRGFYIREDMTVVAGTRDLNRTHWPTECRKVTTVYVPKDYKPGHLVQGDIAVLKLRLPLTLTEEISILRPLHMPIFEDNTNYVGKIVTIAGFGVPMFETAQKLVHAHRTQSILQFTTTRVVDSVTCQQSHPEKNIHNKLICTQGTEYNHSSSNGVCLGDTGGPLVLQGTRTVIGILSRIPSNCNPAKPAIYTNVQHYMEFITVAVRGGDTNLMNIYLL